MAPEEDDSLQAALSAQVRKTNFEHRRAAVYDHNGSKKCQESRCPKAESSDLSTLTQAIFNMKAKMGITRRAMTNAGISFDTSPNQRKPKEQAVNGKQDGKFAG